MIQLLYTSLVAACIYSIGIMVSNTIQFVTSEKDTECEVLFNEIPSSYKNVHIKNIIAAAKDIDTFEKALDSYMAALKKPTNESISLASLTTYATGVKAAAAGLIAAHPVGVAIAAGAITLMLIPKILVLVREIIYSIYFMRVKVSEMLAIQADLINTNVESLESRGGSKKVIARQKKIAQKLSKWQNIIAVKVDSVNGMVSSQKSRENRQLDVDSDSPIAQDPGSGGDIML